MIKAIIIEDEEIAAKRLQKIIQEIDDTITVTHTISSVKEAIHFLKHHEQDLIFLDINLSDGYSFEIFEQLSITTPIIFTTAYSEFAIKAFEQNSISYLLKPVCKDALKKALEKYKTYRNTTIDYGLLQKLVTGNHYKKRFLIKTNNSLKTYNIEDIAYFYSEDKLTFMKLWNAKILPVNYSLKNLEDLLDPISYFRINRKYIIHSSSINKMHYVSKSKIKITLTPSEDHDNAPIFVAIEKIGGFKKWLSL